jgi:hypothetical protein
MGKKIGAALVYMHDMMNENQTLGGIVLLHFLKSWTNNYFAKLVLFGCFVISIPLLALGTYSYITSSEMIQAQTKREEAQLLIQLQLTMEQVLETVNHSVTHLLNSSLMERSMNADFSGNDFRLYNELKEGLNHLQTFDTGIQDIVILNPRNNWFMNNQGLFRWAEITNPDLHAVFRTPAG